MSAIEKLKAQQADVKERSPQWMVAEQLMDLCRREPACEALLDKDLDAPALSIVEAEKQIKAFADAHRTGAFACVTPVEADGILRKFYGLPEAPEAADAAPAAGADAPPLGGLRLEDFLA